jgi:hypothetical protein
MTAATCENQIVHDRKHGPNYAYIAVDHSNHADQPHDGQANEGHWDEH